MTSTPSRRPRGQPPRYGLPMTKRINVQATEADYAEIIDAVPEGESVSRWIVEAALERARR